MKVIAIGGEPGTGKTTLMWKLIEQLKPEPKFSEFKLVPYHQKDNVYILGKYEEGETFAGTDRMSMSVQPEAIKFLATLPNSKIKPEISAILKSIISDEQLKTYENLLLQETMFRELVNELKLAGLINVIVRHSEITGTVKVKDFLNISNIADNHELTTIEIQTNKEFSEIFIKLAKVQTSSQK